MTINGRTKGHSGERDICTLLRKHFPDTKIERNVDQTRDGGADILSLRPFAIEVKRQQNLSVNAWLKQAEDQTTEKNPVPVLVYRQNHKPWTWMIPLSVVAKKKLCIPRYISVDTDTFIEVAKYVIARKKKL